MTTATTTERSTRVSRSTALQSRRRAYDLVLASHYHYDGLGYRRVARLFGLPRSTVADAIKRIDRDDPDLRTVAVRWGHLRPDAAELGPIVYRDPGTNIDLGL